MNLPQELINILAGLAFSVGGWFARVIWVAVRDLEKDPGPAARRPAARVPAKSEAHEAINDLGTRCAATSSGCSRCWIRRRTNDEAPPAPTLPDWRDILRRAWSIRLMLLAGLLSGCEAVLSATGTDWSPCRAGPRR